METNIQSRIALGQEQMFDSVGAHIHIRYISTLKKETIERVCWSKHEKKNTKNTVKSKKFNCNNFSFKWLPVVKVKI